MLYSASHPESKVDIREPKRTALQWLAWDPLGKIGLRDTCTRLIYESQGILVVL